MKIITEEWSRCSAAVCQISTWGSKEWKPAEMIYWALKVINLHVQTSEKWFHEMMERKSVHLMFILLAWMRWRPVSLVQDVFCHMTCSDEASGPIISSSDSSLNLKPEARLESTNIQKVQKSHQISSDLSFSAGLHKCRKSALKSSEDDSNSEC